MEVLGRKSGSGENILIIEDSMLVMSLKSSSES